MIRANGPSLGSLAYLVGCVMAGLYFLFSAVQGDYGVLKRTAIEAEKHQLTQELASADADVARMENLTKRLSDSYLDLDLLDERARAVLGLVRADEIVIR
ncbi:MAG: septum formation initiator family protein [Limimaricola sp.]|uniref:FtsB family cell division protein n=1 Tax=Limimaricola sp. TaxID=2211665 RepID=UPI001D52313F|nr:septum formation initiator family protein [Limimaricola sp.]MBI1418371.1 septum formation initiator family protein [Limimaricola sp.]